MALGAEGKVCSVRMNIERRERLSGKLRNNMKIGVAVTSAESPLALFCGYCDEYHVLHKVSSV